MGRVGTAQDRGVRLLRYAIAPISDTVISIPGAGSINGLNQNGYGSISYVRRRPLVVLPVVVLPLA